MHIRGIQIALIILITSCSTVNSSGKDKNTISDPMRTYTIRYENFKDSNLRIEQLLGNSNALDSKSISAYLKEVIEDISIMKQCVDKPTRDKLHLVYTNLLKYRDDVDKNVYTSATIDSLSVTLKNLKESFAPNKVSFVAAKIEPVKKDPATQPNKETVEPNKDKWIYISSLQVYLEKLTANLSDQQKTALYHGRIKTLLEKLQSSQPDDKISSYINWYKSLSTSTDEFKKIGEKPDEIVTQLNSLLKLVKEYATE